MQTNELWLVQKDHFWGCTRGVMVNTIGNVIVVSEFNFIRTVTFTFGLGKGMNPLNLPAISQIVQLLSCDYDGFGII